MNIKTTNLKSYRKRVDVPLSDVAHLLQMDASNLLKVEHGLRDPNPNVILLYHILFKVPLTDLLAQQYHEQKLLWQRRSQMLIEQLQTAQSSKSKLRIAYLLRFVNSLNNRDYEG